MNIFFDETGQFKPSVGRDELSAVMGLIIPETNADSFHKSFDEFLQKLPRSCFQNGEPKGRLISTAQHIEFAERLNANAGIMLVPTTFNRNISSPTFACWPRMLRERLEAQAQRCVHAQMREQVLEVARRCANLNGAQLARLLTYKVGLERALDAICLFYHCTKYHHSYSPISVTFDQTGVPNNREELVFRDMLYLWVTRNTFTTVKQIHTDSHPFVLLYGRRVDGKRAFDVSKMISGNP